MMARSIGGARPKATIVADGRKYIAKFSSQNDLYSVVKAEFIAMRLAYEVGLSVAPVGLQQAGGKDILLIERFDRERAKDGWRRRAMVSALTLLELDEATQDVAARLGPGDPAAIRLTGIYHNLLRQWGET